ncbi:MAG: ribosomal RNA small subunit methyltransferase A [Candidatus Omnitrophica bacterium]|nr:ribosomal RNA small subunit methyltransferase A [Candidatus Omnitrophota bacterium]
MLTKSQLKDIFCQYSFRPLKRFGENYLIDSNVKDKIIDEAHIGAGDIVLEVGPGLGALTVDLAKTGATVYAVEKDKKAFAILSDIVTKGLPNLKLSCGDILDFDIDSISSEKAVKVVGNLPYYITTPILEGFIRHRAAIGSILIVVQKEFADRILAEPGSKAYGSLSCFIRYYMKPAYLHTVKRGCFYPEPKVDSSLIRLDVLKEPSVKVGDEALFFKIVRSSFGQRRKTIINSLSRKEALDMPKDKLAAILERAGIDPTARPESLPLEAFAAIANAI